MIATPQASASSNSVLVFIPGQATETSRQASRRIDIGT
jgi:hypothetical protein